MIFIFPIGLVAVICDIFVENKFFVAEIIVYVRNPSSSFKKK